MFPRAPSPSAGPPGGVKAPGSRTRGLVGRLDPAPGRTDFRVSSAFPRRDAAEAVKGQSPGACGSWPWTRLPGTRGSDLPVGHLRPLSPARCCSLSRCPRPRRLSGLVCLRDHDAAPLPRSHSEISVPYLPLRAAATPPTGAFLGWEGSRFSSPVTVPCSVRVTGPPHRGHPPRHGHPRSHHPGERCVSPRRWPVFSDASVRAQRQTFVSSNRASRSLRVFGR